jgi:hypothetical protein
MRVPEKLITREIGCYTDTNAGVTGWMGESPGRPADTHEVWSDDEKLVEVVTVSGKNIVEALHSCGQRHIIAEAKENHPKMGLAEPEDKLTKIQIIGNKNPLPLVGDGQNAVIGKAGGIIAPDAGDVVSLLRQVFAQPGISVFV